MSSPHEPQEGEYVRPSERAIDALVGDLVAALDFYADPDTYFAVAFWFDPPCGSFREDFSDDHGHPEYARAMPGAKAREVIEAHREVLLLLLGVAEQRIRAAEEVTDD